MAQIKVRKTKFVDIDMNFGIHPISSDVSKRVDSNAISTALKNLIMTKVYDRPFHPELSSQVADMLFENITKSTMINLERAVRYVIQNFEPRVEVVDVNVNTQPDNNHLEIEIYYIIIGSVEVVSTKFYIERTL